MKSRCPFHWNSQKRKKIYTIHYSRHRICIGQFSYCVTFKNIPCSAILAVCHYVLLVTPWHAFPMSTTFQHAKHLIPCLLFPFAGWLRFIFFPFPGRHLILLKIRKPVRKLQVFIRSDTLNDLKVDSLYGVFFFFVRSSFSDTFPSGLQILVLGGTSLFC